MASNCHKTSQGKELEYRQFMFWMNSREPNEALARERKKREKRFIEILTTIWWIAVSIDLQI